MKNLVLKPLHIILIVIFFIIGTYIGILLELKFYNDAVAEQINAQIEREALGVI